MLNGIFRTIKLSKNRLRAIVRYWFVQLSSGYEPLNKVVDKKKSAKYFVSIVTIVKNEADYIIEWVEYHRLIGIDHIYLYDNQSTDNVAQKLKPYIDEGFVSYVFFPGENMQLEAYRHAVKQYGSETEWLALLDADEFLVMVDKEQSFSEFLKKQSQETSQLLIGWMVFGSSGKKNKQPGLVLERFKWHALDDYLAEYKPVIRPQMALKINFPHWFDVSGKTVDENGKRYFEYPFVDSDSSVAASKNIVRINHYYSKSWEEFINKRNRGFADHEGDVRSKNDFIRHDQNFESDKLIDDIIERLKKRISDF